MANGERRARARDACVNELSTSWAPADIANPSTIGTIGEHLVCADLRKQGYISFFASSDCAYDVVLDTSSRLLRVQVKTTRKIGPRRNKTSDMPTWEFKLFRSASCYDGPRFYENGEYDILATVALDISLIAYFPYSSSRRNCITLRSADYLHLEKNHWPGKYFQDHPLEKVLKILQEQRETADWVLGEPVARG